MACRSCSSKSGIPAGCKSNGTCASGGCNKMEVYDWLANMSLPQHQEPFLGVEIRFKNDRKGYYANREKLPLQMGDCVAVEAQSGHDIGVVSLTGELVRMQMRRKKVNEPVDELPAVYRKANDRDIEKWRDAQNRETDTMYKSREIALRLGLKMKLSDVEFQGDNSKATFYYTSDDRVDFRQLIRELASVFRVRIEMRQIGARQESARLGGIGSCGRELCCSSWMTDFRSVNTGAARYQQLSLNPQKLAGQCGKLKCCLNFELDSYLDALKDFPNTNKRLKTKKGDAAFQKMDLFRGMLWYSYVDEYGPFIQLTAEAVHTILAQNEKGQRPECLEDFCKKEEVVEVGFENSEGEGDITRFDRKNQNRGKRKGRNHKSRKPNQSR
jgi:cell fate regulator YaaT (PSP1 superfamily)